METINPKNFIDIDPSLVSFITLKDGNMIMLDDSAPVKPTKEKNKIIQEEEKSNIKEKKSMILAVSFPMNFSYKGNKKKKIILEISKNINFSYNKIDINNKEKNMPTPNSSIDFKSSMLQSKKDITNLNINNSTTINKNVISEDNVNIRMTDTLISKQTTINVNNYNDNFIENKNEEIMPSNNLSTLNNNNNNNNNNEINLYKKTDENIQAYTFKANQNNNDINNENDKNNEEREIENKKLSENQDTFKQMVFKNSNINNNKIQIPSSLIIQNNNYIGRIKDTQKRTTMTEVFIEEEENNKDINKTFNRINKRQIKDKNDGNYVKAVISINIPGEEKKDSNIVKQFNSLVDRLNGQKSKEKIKNIKKSDRFYELYKKPSDNFILDRILSPKKSKRKIPHDYLKDISSFLNNSEMSTVSSGKGSSLNSRILALKERTNPNNSFRADNENNAKEKNDIVLPSNFLYSK